MFISFDRPLCAVGFAVFATTITLVSPASAEPAPPYETLIEYLDRTPTALEAEALLDAANARAQQARALPNCRVPDDSIVHNCRPLLLARETLEAALAEWSPDSKC